MEKNQVRKNIRRNSHQQRCFYVGDTCSNRLICKYMDLESAIISIASNSLRFVEPFKWQDQYESRFYNASYVNVPNALGNTPTVLASCFSYAAVNETAWKLYSYTKTGLGAHCVKLRINKKAFREQIVKNNKDYNLFEGMVNYNLDNYQISNLHKSHGLNGNANNLFLEVFENFDLSAYLSLLLIKRQVFRHEQEIRYFLIPNKPAMKGFTESENVNIEWKEILVDIKVDECCSDLELDILKQILSSKGINILPQREYIYSSPESHIVIDAI